MLAPVHVKKMEKGRTEALAKERIGKVGLADKVVFMADGRILEEGKPEEIFSNPKTPEARQFLRSVLDLSCAYQSRLLNGMKVAYSGVEGAYGYIAARRMFPEAQLIAYPDFAAFDAAFGVGKEMLTGLTALGAERGVEFDEQGFAASAPLMRIQLKALVAQRLFDTAAFYRVMNPAQNEAYRRAVEILADWEHKGESLLAPED